MKYLIPALLISALSSNLALGLTARVYCFYVPKDLKAQPAAAQLNGLKYEKILKPNSTETKTFDVTDRGKYFGLAEDNYFALAQECKTYVKGKGKFIDLKGSDHSYREFLTSFYVIRPEGMKEPSDEEKARIKEEEKEYWKELYAGKDAKSAKAVKEASDALEKTGKAEILAQVIEENPGLLSKLANKAKLTGQAASDLSKNLSENSDAQGVLKVAAMLADIYFPAYAAGATYLLIPLVYSALLGPVPSMLGLAYWFIYFPLQVYSAVWVANNANSLASQAKALFKGSKPKPLDTKSTKKEIKETLEAAAE